LTNSYPLPNVNLMWIIHSSAETQLWQSHYISRMQQFVSMLGSNTIYVNLTDD